MTEKVSTISHAVNKTGTITTSEVAVTFPTSSITGSPVNHSVRNSTQLKLFSASLGFQRVQFLAFLLLGIMLLAVVFLLPGVIEPPTPKQITQASEQVKTVAPTPDSPWSDAQLAKQRREAQEILSKILDLQEKLENRKVNQWAAQDFKQAMDVAASGDRQYRQRNFTQAQTNYLQSLQLFETLFESVNTVYKQQIDKGLQAINDNQPQVARDSYQLAMYLVPDSQVAQEGLKRAEAQDQVIELLKDGEHLLKISKLQEARQKFVQALALDDKSNLAQQQLTVTNQAIKDENFSKAMSEGYSALNSQQYSQAIKAFTDAGKIRPNAQDAHEALVLATNKNTQSSIGAHLAKAQDLEKQEQWKQANDLYSKVMILDKSVIKGRIGTIRTDARAKLDNKIQTALDKPERLTNAKVYLQSKKTYQEAKKIKNPGSRLKSQISQLDSLLAKLQKPVAVKFQSNNQTTVTLYKFGNLGNFTAKSMDLKPGKYTLIGTRDGYRDVRREFTLTAGATATTVIVQCEDKITNG